MVVHADPLLDRIVDDPRILVGKPTIRGTRISVEIVLERLSGGESFEDLLSDYPHLIRDDIYACLRFAAEQLKGPGTDWWERPE